MSILHYAATCDGPAPLQYLLEIGHSPLLVTKKKQTPLHCAVKAGRVQNVKVCICYSIIMTMFSIINIETSLLK